MTYKEKAIQLMIEHLGICYLDAEDIVVRGVARDERQAVARQQRVE